MGLNDDKSGVPDDWFIDPALRQLFVDDSNADTNPLAWQRDAICSQTDPEAFFPEKGGSTRDAKRICLGCDVKQQCLEYALQNDERFGIWGGLSERERRKLKRRA
ncbi:MAG: WhiB family transcriptional regulator [Microbacteriaceae bacterium]|nr:WhiB family transcriptional regulator [Microbacteriaceae bacterium]